MDAGEAWPQGKGMGRNLDKIFTKRDLHASESTQLYSLELHSCLNGSLGMDVRIVFQF